MESSTSTVPVITSISAQQPAVSVPTPAVEAGLATVVNGKQPTPVPYPSPPSLVQPDLSLGEADTTGSNSANGDDAFLQRFAGPLAAMEARLSERLDVKFMWLLDQVDQVLLDISHLPEPEVISETLRRLRGVINDHRAQGRPPPTLEPQDESRLGSDKRVGARPTTAATVSASVADPAPLPPLSCSATRVGSTDADDSAVEGIVQSPDQSSCRSPERARPRKEEDNGELQSTADVNGPSDHSSDPWSVRQHGIEIGLQRVAEAYNSNGAAPIGQAPALSASVQEDTANPSALCLETGDPAIDASEDEQVSVKSTASRTPLSPSPIQMPSASQPVPSSHSIDPWDQRARSHELSSPARPLRKAALAAREILATPIPPVWKEIFSRPMTPPSKRKGLITDYPYNSPWKRRRRQKSLSVGEGDKWKTLGKSDGTKRGEGMWPPFPPHSNTWIMLKQEIICDMCNGRIHWACAGLEKDTVHDVSPWYCPDCLVHFKNDTRDLVLPAPPDSCVRHDCYKRRNRTIKIEEMDEQRYCISKVLGRRAVARDPTTKKRVFQYLVLWDGYPLDEATWEPVENFDVDGDGHCALLTDFETAALRQQVDIRKRVAILPEAQGGWDRLTGDPLVSPEGGEGE